MASGTGLWIHKRLGWPGFAWDGGALAARLAEARHRQGLLLGRMEGLGFALRREGSQQAVHPRDDGRVGAIRLLGDSAAPATPKFHRHHRRRLA